MHNAPERRSAHRRSLFLRAEVSWPGIDRGVSCSIQDASRSGCQIMSDAVPEMPEQISVRFCGLGETREGRIVWRKGNAAGVKFLAAESQASG